MESFRIVGVRTPLVENLEENMKNVPVFWKQIIQNDTISEIFKLSNGNPDGVLGVTVYNAFTIILELPAIFPHPREWWNI